MTTLKPALTLDQQIDRLVKVHNVSITDRNHAKEILNRVNYYRLSAYGVGLRDPDNPEKYVHGVTLQSLFNLYCFDSQFRNNLIHTIEQLEIQLRSQVSYCLAINYGPDGYMNHNNFRQIKRKREKVLIHENIIQSFQKEVKRQANVPFVKHHSVKYDGNFPIWVAIELFSFGNLCSLYSIMKSPDQKAIAQQYDTSSKYLKSWILALVEVRNICAHYTRLYNLPLKQTPSLYSENECYRQEINKIFPVLLVVKRMLKNNEQWASFYRDITKTLDKYKDDINFSFMGFPENWQYILESPLTIPRREKTQDD